MATIQMPFMLKTLEQVSFRFAFRYIRRRLQGVSSNLWKKESSALLLRAFRKACRKSPAYRAFLETAGVVPSSVKTGADVTARVPILDKTTFFKRYSLLDIHPDMKVSRTGRVWSSSGSTGILSLGFEPPKSSSFSLSLDFMLDFFFSTLTKRTLLLNCIPDGWPIASKLIQVSNIGTRTDLGVSLLRQLSADVDQFLICAEPLLLKKLLEDAVSAGVDFSKTRVHLFIGGEYVSEHLRQYLRALINPGAVPPPLDAPNLALASMGMAEFGVSVFFETPAVAALREALVAQKVPSVSLFGPSFETIPQIFQYSPFSTFVETVNNGDTDSLLVLSDLNPKVGFPLIRFKTADSGCVFLHEDFLTRLRQKNIQLPMPLEFPFPFVVTQGRKYALSLDGNRLSDLSAIKDTLYSFRGILPEITGYFVLSPKEADFFTRIEVQLKPGGDVSAVHSTEKEALVESFSQMGLAMTFIPYQQFSAGMGHLFDRKFTYQN